MAPPVLNTRADLDAIAGTTQHDEFMTYLRGSMTKTVDTQTYPEGYGQPGYAGPALAPVWQTVQDLSIVTRFGFTAADFPAS